MADETSRAEELTARITERIRANHAKIVAQATIAALESLVAEDRDRDDAIAGVEAMTRYLLTAFHIERDVYRAAILQAMGMTQEEFVAHVRERREQSQEGERGE